MAGKFCMSLILLVVFAVFLQTSAATTYTVGDSNGWIIPSDTSAYATWAAGKTFLVGDILVFNFVSGSHDVAEVTKSGYDGCDSNNPIILETTGPASITLTSSGDKYYICTFGRHCSVGQKLAITVSSSTPSPPPTTSSPPPVSPPPMASTPTPSSPPPMASTPAPATSPRASTPVPATSPRASTPVPAMGPSPPPSAQTPSSTASPPSMATPPPTSSSSTPPTSSTVPSTPSGTNAPPPSNAPASLSATGVFAAFLTTAVVLMIQ